MRILDQPKGFSSYDNEYFQKWRVYIHPNAQRIQNWSLETSYCQLIGYCYRPGLCTFLQNGNKCIVEICLCSLRDYFTRQSLNQLKVICFGQTDCTLDFKYPRKTNYQCIHNGKSRTVNANDVHITKAKAMRSCCTWWVRIRLSCRSCMITSI